MTRITLRHTCPETPVCQGGFSSLRISIRLATASTPMSTSQHETMDANVHDALLDEPAGGPQGSWMPDDWANFSNTSAPQHFLMPQAEWPPSPPSLHGEELGNYSFDTPFDVMNGSLPTASGYNPSTLSPRGWPQDTSAVWNSSNASHPSQQPMDAAEHDALSSHDQPSRRGSPAMLADSLPTWSMSPADSHQDSLSPSDSPYAMQEEDYAVKAEDALMGSDTVIKTEDGCDGGQMDQMNTARQDEPYAQLIYRALLSRPGHSMTLQEIYQWFRENTDKIKGRDKITGKENKGWQNSIRHNLSMNMAFGKRDKPDNWTLDTPSSPGKPKKSTEWILQPWAVTEGVESTTRYRKNDAARRTRTSPARGSTSPVRRSRHLTFYPHPINPGQTIPGRAKSGRIGGRAAARQVALRQANTLMNGQGAPGASSSPSSTYPVAAYEPMPGAPMHCGHHLHHQPQASEFQANPFQPSMQGDYDQQQRQQQQQLYHQHHNQHHMAHGLEMPLAAPDAALQGVPPSEAALAFQHHQHHQQQPGFDMSGTNLSDVRGMYPGDGHADGEEGTLKWCAGYDGISRQ